MARNPHNPIRDRLVSIGQRYVDEPVILPVNPIADAAAEAAGRDALPILSGYKNVRLNWIGRDAVAKAGR